MSFLHRHKGVTPYLLLLPGIVWLALFFVAPLGFLGYQSLQTGTFDTGYTFDWAFSNYWDALSEPQRGALCSSLGYPVPDRAPERRRRAS